MAYQLPQRHGIASKRLTATLIGIYLIITLLVVLLNTDNNGGTSSSKRSGYSGTANRHAVIKPAAAYQTN